MLNTRILLAARPRGVPTPSDFCVEQVPLPVAGPGEVLVRTIYLSLDPYVRGRIGDASRVRAQVPLGAVIEGGTVGEVVSSRDSRFKSKDLVLGANGWQEYGVQNGDGLRRLEPAVAPVSTALGVLGMPGFTAYVGLHVVAAVRPGETVAVAAASGPVGSMVGQMARLAGAHVIGIAGGTMKVDWLREIGFDSAIDHRLPGLDAALAEAAPAGIDVYFENVGGDVLNAVLPQLNSGARIPVCGLAAQYNGASAGVPTADALMSAVLYRRLCVTGFTLVEHEFEHSAEFRRRASDWLARGLIHYREDVEVGLENAPRAFARLLTGKTFGKALIRVATDPARR